MQLQSVSIILAWTLCWISLSRIWLMVQILHDIRDAWLHRSRCSRVSTAPQRWHVSVSWYSCSDKVSDAGGRSLQHFVVITSLWILLIASERHFHSISSKSIEAINYCSPSFLVARPNILLGQWFPMTCACFKML